MQRLPRPVYRDGTFALTRTADRNDLAPALRQRHNEFASRPNKSRPPILWILLRANLIDDMQRECTRGPSMHATVQSYQRAFTPGRSQVNRKYELVVTYRYHSPS